MKKIFTLLTAALVTLTSFADRPDGRITIMDFSNKQLWIEVDGQRYRDRDRETVIDNLHSGYHSVEMYSQERRFNFGSIFDRFGRKQVLYHSTLYVKPGRNICITINRYGQVQIDERKIRGGNRKDRDNDWDRNREGDYDRDGGNDRDWDNGRHREDRDNRYDNTRGAMDAHSFEMFKSALYRESFEKSRMEIVKQTIDRNYFSTAQVREMVLLFTFENNKLELAKYAYPHTVDPDNYYQLYNLFSYGNSKSELAEYIRKNR